MFELKGFNIKDAYVPSLKNIHKYKVLMTSFYVQLRLI